MSLSFLSSASMSGHVQKASGALNVNICGAYLKARPIDGSLAEQGSLAALFTAANETVAPWEKQTLQRTHTWPGLLFMLFPHLLAFINLCITVEVHTEQVAPSPWWLLAAQISNESSLCRNTEIANIHVKWKLTEVSASSSWNMSSVLDVVEFPHVKD